ncbi:TPA: NAD-dependent epimerase/dehydratase family protein, partial [Candidatus Poribacteria bacterium]|nr:NAD-dependent epimerase/dehydratase family protein [Candidatus Poribacteria bacterium]
MSTVLVTGGAGFIGSHLCERLVSEGVEVICLDNFDPFYDPKIKRQNISNLLNLPNFTLIEGDIRDHERLRWIKEGYEIGAVVHLAARAGVRRSAREPLLYEEVNVKGTLNLLETFKGASLKSFIFGSSSSVYGIIRKGPTREEDETSRPISPYSATKKAGELLCHTYHHLYGMPITCLRLFSVYGPRMRPDLAIHKFARLIESGEELPILGDGRAKRDYTFVSDIVDGIISALKRPFGYEVFNLGNSRAVELLEVVRLLEKSLGKAARLKFLPPHPSDVPETYADISKAERMLGYSPKVEIATGIREFVRWFKRHR